ncbi:hypothetical protein BDZ89DRAFT_1163836 [Hymenopellis radicata]|nr:hypothetical protein BDZ89DRAFT_1163836 [Hymenopellis radicata]
MHFQMEEEVKGEFDVEESNESKEAGRAASKSNKGKERPSIKLVAADVAAIDGNERGKAPAKLLAKDQNSKTLPFTASEDHKKWNDVCMRRLLEWFSTLKDSFKSNGHPEFDSTLTAEFNEAFPHLIASKVKLDTGEAIERSAHPAVGVVPRTFIRTHRSNLGKTGSEVVIENWNTDDMQEYDTEEPRAQWVEDQLRDNRFTYQYPDDPTSKGIFRGPLVNATFAYFIELFSKCGYSGKYGPPAGALCLATIAVKRGLMQWASGSFSKGSKFQRVPWGVEASRDFYGAANNLSESKWEDIVFQCQEYIKAKGVEVAVLGDDESGDEKPAQTLFMSP